MSENPMQSGTEANGAADTAAKEQGGRSWPRGRRVLLVFGTRPEALKMCPLLPALRAEGLMPLVCISGQHRELLGGVLSHFGVEPDYRLFAMREGQAPGEVIGKILSTLPPLLAELHPATVLVHGDTVTALGAGLAAFLAGVPVGHVEAGLRTYDLHAPFPEELCRQAIDLLATQHFAPTAAARDNLLREGRTRESVFVTGNTGIDALKATVRADFSHPLLDFAQGGRLVLLTMHRRESHGEPMRRAFRAVRRLAEEEPDLRILCPLHPHPAVQEAGHLLSGCPRLRRTPPLEAAVFHNLLARATLVLTDSGGVQEEAAALGRPTLILRERTERPEGVAAGVLTPVGLAEDGILAACRTLLRDPEAYARAARPTAIYGDGNAAARIAHHVAAFLERD